jgi:excisionase family DNA binding protein
MQSKKILSVRETAEYLGLSELEVRQLSRAGKLKPCQSHLRHIRFSEAEVLSYKRMSEADLLSPSSPAGS